jgi:hypothetical protein
MKMAYMLVVGIFGEQKGGNSIGVRSFRTPFHDIQRIEKRKNKGVTFRYTLGLHFP